MNHAASSDFLAHNASSMCWPYTDGTLVAQFIARVGGAGNLSGKAFNKFYKRSTCSFSGPFDGDKNIITTLCVSQSRYKPNKRKTRKWLIADNNLRRSISHHLGWSRIRLNWINTKAFYVTIRAALYTTLIVQHRLLGSAQQSVWYFQFTHRLPQIRYA